MAASPQRRPDPCVVDARPLSLILRQFKNTWGRRASPVEYDGRTLAPDGDGAVRYLAMRTADIVRSYDPDGLGVPESTIWNLVSASPPRTTSLRTCDLLLVAMNRVDALRSEITVRRNPMLSEKRRVELGIPPCADCGHDVLPAALVDQLQRFQRLSVVA